MIRYVQNLRIGDRAEQVPNQIIQLSISDEVSGLLVRQRSSQHPGQAQQRCVAAGHAIGAAIGADQLTLHAKRRRLQGDKVDVFKGRTINRLAKHDCWVLIEFRRDQGK